MADVALVCLGRHPERAQLGHRGFGGLDAARVVDGDRRSVARQPPCDRQPDAARAACDQRHLAFEFAHVPVLRSYGVPFARRADTLTVADAARFRLCSYVGLEGRVALVTGAGGDGIGRAIALALARDGADLALNWHRKREGAERTAAAIEAMGRRAVLIEADVGDANCVEALVRSAAEQLGQVDILINSAGGPWKPQDVTEIEPAHLRRVLAL
ncbi:MAG: SDR family NAD(P)-dependent oxidoreductase, partial [Dehalococcoidia bacterium]